MKKLFFISILILLTACSSKEQMVIEEKPKPFKSYIQKDNLILNGENRATPSAQKVMRISRNMVENGEIIRGSCWDYLNTAFTRAGYPHSKRHTIFKGKKSGIYADINIIQPGDWIYYINHSYNNVEHSGMFIEWVNYSNKTALMLSYGGEKRNNPARYKVYDLSSVYNIMRVE